MIFSSCPFTVQNSAQDQGNLYLFSPSHCGMMFDETALYKDLLCVSTKSALLDYQGSGSSIRSTQPKSHLYKAKAIDEKLSCVLGLTALIL